MPSPNPKGRPRKHNLDGWSNTLSGLGDANFDKRASSKFAADLLSDDEAMDLWRGNDIAARVVETVPNEMLREGFTLSIKANDETGDTGEKDYQEIITSRYADLGLVDALQTALMYERAYGGGAILLGVLDNGQVWEPLNEGAIREFNFLTVLEPLELKPLYYYADPRAEKYGQVMIYQLTPSPAGPAKEAGFEDLRPIEVHESRLVTFDGIRTSRRQTSPSGWGDSHLNRVWRVLRDFDQTWESAGVLVQDFAQAVFKIKGLAEIVARDGADAFMNRLKAANLTRSVLRAMVIDADGEEFERKQTPIAGLPEMLRLFMTRMSAAADMPVTLLFGQSPDGLNATGASDIRFFYDRVKSLQTRKLVKPIERITKLLMLAEKGEPDNWSISFNPLWQPTAKEKAEERMIVAQTDAIYIANDVASPEEVAVSRWGGDQYSPDMAIDFDEREQLEAEAEAQEEDPNGGDNNPDQGLGTGERDNPQDPGGSGDPIGGADPGADGGTKDRPPRR